MEPHWDINMEIQVNSKFGLYEVTGVFLQLYPLKYLNMESLVVHSM